MSPGSFDVIRRVNNKFGAGIDAIFGRKGKGPMKVQAIRFDAKRFTPAQAKKWLSDNNYKPIVFEPATGGKEIDMPDEVKEVVEEKCGDYGMAMPMPMVPPGVTSFADLAAVEATEEATDEVHELASQFQGIVNNIMGDMMLEDKATAVKNAAAEFATLVDQAMSGAENKENEEAVKAVWSTALQDTFPDSSFLFVESGGAKDGEGKTVPRSKRHFVFADKTGKVDVAHLRNAIARIPQSNAPGLTAAKKTALQDEARKKLAAANKESWLSEALSAVGEFFGLKPKETPAPEPSPDPGLMLWKEGERYRWLAVFSNKYRDNDNPPEILASQAHKEFVSAVEKGEWPYPELRHWHIKGSRWGMADWLTYDEKTGFTLASGLVDAGHEKEAVALAALIDAGKSIKTSHGMPTSEIQRDKEDPTIITRYRTVEISDLPGWAAANPLTGFEITSKEGDMPIPESKVPYLKDAGVTDEEIEMVNAMLAGKAKEAENLESKEAPAEAAPVEAPAETPAAPEAPAPITREEIIAAIQAAVGPLAAAIAEVQAGQKELKEAREVEAKDILAATPAFSLVEMLKAGGRAVGDPVAQVEKGTRVKGPKETKPDAAAPVVGIPFISQLITGASQQQD